MPPPMPVEIIRSERIAADYAIGRAGRTLLRWKDTEPVRLYVFGVLAAVLLVLVVVGAVTEDLAAALTGVAAAVLVAVPGAAAARASVHSPSSFRRARRDDAARWAAITARDAA